MLGLDDLQWADPSSLLALGAIVGRVQHLPVGVIASLRPLPRRPELTTLLASLGRSGARVIEVGGLDPTAAETLVGDLVGSPPGPGLLAAVSKAAGNPLFIGELLSALDADGAMAIADGRADVHEPAALSSTLRLTILRRLLFLSEPALDVLRAGSILGSSFTLTDISVTMDQPAIDLLPAVAEALAAKVLEEDGDRVRFRHDLIRDAVYEELPRPRGAGCIAKPVSGWPPPVDRSSRSPSSSAAVPSRATPPRSPRSWRPAAMRRGRHRPSPSPGSAGRSS